MQYSSPQETKSLYLHWPFCPYRCHFCPFVALASHDEFMGQYQDALINEIKHFSAQCTQKQLIETIYLGGGTPSTYPDALILDTFDTLKSIFTFSNTIEVTIEVNPGTVRPEQLALWKEIGITKIR